MLLIGQKLICRGDKKGLRIMHHINRDYSVKQHTFAGKNIAETMKSAGEFAQNNLKRLVSVTVIDFSDESAGDWFVCNVFISDKDLVP